MNTVKKAQKLAKLCRDFIGEDLSVLHSSFLANDRVDRENDLMKKIGKNAKRPESMVVIGTQVIEQSLDIDFDCLITDLAPMDLIFQRIGRLHRHEITRPSKYRLPKVYILGSSPTFNFDEGSKAVYGGYLLARTQNFLKSTLKLPNDISTLVQKVYHEIDGDMTLKGEEAKLYNQYKKQHENKLKDKESRAKIFRISNPRGFGSERKNGKKSYTIMGWLDNAHANHSEAFGLAQVRDSAESIEVILVKEVEGGYSFINSEENIKFRIDEPSIAMKLASNTVRLPGVLTYPNRIDETIKELEKLNMAYLSEWQEESWLKGSLGIVLRDGKINLCGYELVYDELLGLMYEREEDNE